MQTQNVNNGILTKNGKEYYAYNHFVKTVISDAINNSFTTDNQVKDPVDYIKTRSIWRWRDDISFDNNQDMIETILRSFLIQTSKEDFTDQFFVYGNGKYIKAKKEILKQRVNIKNIIYSIPKNNEPIKYRYFTVKDILNFAIDKYVSYEKI
jgi:cupin superfamily acireductone dioxygenase involved in methionine salvage